MVSDATDDSYVFINAGHQFFFSYEFIEVSHEFETALLDEVHVVDLVSLHIQLISHSQVEGFQLVDNLGGKTLSPSPEKPDLLENYLVSLLDDDQFEV